MEYNDLLDGSNIFADGAELFTSARSNRARKRLHKNLDDTVNSYDSIKNPDFNQLYQQYNPREQAQSALANLRGDELADAYQRQGLGRLAQYADNAGALSPEEVMAQQNLIKDNISRSYSADQNVLNNLRNRGLAGGGASLAVGLNSANRQSQAISNQNNNNFVNAYNRSLGANQALLQGAGGFRRQAFGEGVTRGQATDNINRFNTGNFNQAALRNANQRQSANQQVFQNALNKTNHQNAARNRKSDQLANQYNKAGQLNSIGQVANIGSSILKAI